MVAKIISGKSIRAALSYNENKVDQGKAELIWQSGFKKEVQRLNFHDKLGRFQNLTKRNKRAKTNAVHISLNFAVNERVDETQLNAIARDYMEGIGFGDQPFLVYLHKDAGHPHIHIVTTNIRHSGERISLHNLGKTKSEEARKLIEKRYGLVPAQQHRELYKSKALALSKVFYGKDDTKRAISNVVHGVIQSYRFTSLPEFNAVLSCYNVFADRGSRDSVMYAKKGLRYWAMDEHGKKVGIPIKASSIYSSPTLQKLELKFASKKIARKPNADQLKAAIDRVMKNKITSERFERALSTYGIDVLFRRNGEGRLYGVTFVDHNTKCVFNGSDLGKAYSANALSQWFLSSQTAGKAYRLSGSNERSQYLSPITNGTVGRFYLGKGNLLEELLKPEFDDNLENNELKRKRKKRRRKIQN
ncbi:relaxase/mobilization nuclease domain-containing protein [Albibacterium profundi]|uniref:Relaxase/mobilization nuclease domain-containing protein n=1 Tax=Albibacterium profundi TaxID=3134906 RepID=A0ABV5CFR7_9SPHI